MLNIQKCDKCEKVRVKHGEKWSDMQKDNIAEWSRQQPLVVNYFVCDQCVQNSKTLTELAGQTC